MIGVHLSVAVIILHLCVNNLLEVNSQEMYSFVVQFKNNTTSEKLKDIIKIIVEKCNITAYRKLHNLDENMFFFEGYRDKKDRFKRDTLLFDFTLDSQILWIQEDIEIKRYKRRPIDYRDANYKFNDPLFPKMWYINNTNSGMKIDMNVTQVWDMGLTGKGVVVTILDDGIEHNHTDLADNYDSDASWDINGADPDPFPRYDQFNDNKHGTRCAGEVAAVANNSFCGVGVAFNAKIGGVRMLDGKITDRIEAEALSLNPQHIDIYSSSWGPNDDGKSVEKPGFLADLAFQNGISKGRGGLGNIYVWASGNGGHHGDDCNCDGYANSIYTLTVSSATESGGVPWYSESCAVTLVSTPSSGSYGQQKIITTDLHNSCTDKHTGTSASAPLLAGIIALALEANPKLSWRDVQHMLVWSANPIPLLKNAGWRINGVGLKFNKKFGFGLVDSYSLISMITHPGWYSIGTISNTCESPINSSIVHIFSRQPSVINIHVDSCSNSILYLEYVQLEVDIQSEFRGHLSIDLESPSGTVSTILSYRPEDSSKDGFVDWKFNTAHMWGESTDGDWKIIIYDRTPYQIDQAFSRIPVGKVNSCKLQFFGSIEIPFYMNYYRQKIQSNENLQNRMQRRQTIMWPFMNKNEILIANNDTHQMEIKLLSSFIEHRLDIIVPSYTSYHNVIDENNSKLELASQLDQLKR